ncbi:MAG: DNA alkylation repair protein [Tannerellaceae bacterium]|jgi:hypothetical protein|nr:DNA alkylation repair protein [Tannerellaceae bacterium]
MIECLRMLNDIRSKLRTAMNGVVSTSMREYGVDYRLNFGVSLPEIRKIAAQYTKDSVLADTLWAQNVRELKIMATLLHPVEGFTREKAVRWVADIRYQEIAEQYNVNLLQYLSFAEELADSWIIRDEEFVVVTGFLLYARLCSKGHGLLPEHAVRLFVRARNVMDAGLSRQQRAAVLALKRYGRQGRRQAAEVLDVIADYSSSGSPEKQEFFNDVKFEFDFYF